MGPNSIGAYFQVSLSPAQEDIVKRKSTDEKKSVKSRTKIIQNIPILAPASDSRCQYFLLREKEGKIISWIKLRVRCANPFSVSLLHTLLQNLSLFLCAKAHFLRVVRGPLLLHPRKAFKRRYGTANWVRLFAPFAQTARQHQSS